MKVVLDTNVLVSALLKPYSKPASILNLILSQKLSLCCDARILQEYREVLARPKFEFPENQTRMLVDHMWNIAEKVTPSIVVDYLADLDDAIFLEVAISAKALFLITGNIKDFGTKKHASVEILTPDTFLKRLALNT